MSIVNFIKNKATKKHFKPKSEEQLIATLKYSMEHKIIDKNSMQMIEGVLKISKEQVRDIMVPRAQMTYLKQDQKITDIVNIITNSRHSRFPVICEHKDNIVGIVLAKDLLRYVFKKNDDFDIKTILRAPIFIPESKKLDHLLNDFQIKHNHMAIVVDEYGGVSGIITIEDVIEKIVGDIEDEHFIPEEEFIIKQSENVYYVKGTTLIETLNNDLGANIPDKDFDTVGGIIASGFGSIPKVGTTIRAYDLTIVIKKVSKKQILSMQISTIVTK
jgi:magnesium and cobalt transporter